MGMGNTSKVDGRSQPWKAGESQEKKKEKKIEGSQRGTGSRLAFCLRVALDWNVRGGDWGKTQTNLPVFSFPKRGHLNTGVSAGPLKVKFTACN